MSGFLSKSFNANNYKNQRPSYPSALFEKLFNYHKGETSLAIDIGCGTGEASYDLLAKFDKVIGTDISPLMVDEANKSIPAEYQGRIYFKVSSAEDLDWIEDASVDLITCAECIHYFKHDVFFNQVHRVLKPKGTLAYWSYGFIKLVDIENYNELFEKYVFGNDKMGPYWTYPGINHIRYLLKDVNAPSTLFKDIKKVESEDHSNPDAVTIKQTFQDFGHFEMFIKTWSGYSAWKAAHFEEPDVCKEFVDALRESSRGKEFKEGIKGEYDFVYVFCTN